MLLSRSHTPIWVCQHEFANISLTLEGRFMFLRSHLLLSVIMQTSHEKYRCRLIIRLSHFHITENRKFSYEGHVYNIYFLPLNNSSFAVLKSFENIPKHYWNAQKSQGDPQKSYEELGIFGGLRLSQFVSSLTADHYIWCSGVFLAVSRLFRGIMGCFGGVPGCSRVFQVLQTPTQSLSLALNLSVLESVDGFLSLMLHLKAYRV